MPVLLTPFRSPAAPRKEWSLIEALAQQLLARLNAPATFERLSAANRPGSSSAGVQAACKAEAEAIGFVSERTGLFADSVAGLRPDYYLRVGDVGVILEVERGKTTTNNMDLLDFWKCHICPTANYLFLLVPQELRHNESMAPKREYESVKRRLQQFFEPGNYTNVRGLCLFGY